MTQIVIDDRYQGPPASANGGYVAGLLARHAGGDVDVWLRAPVPLGRPLAVRPISTDAIGLFDGDQLVAEARAASLDFALPGFVDPFAAKQASSAYIGFERHPLPGCFVCGPERQPGDGLRIFAGPVPGRENLVAAPWSPDASLADDDGIVWPEIVWGALDCPSAFAVDFDFDRLMLLGRIGARVVEPVRAGEDYVITATSLGEDGRKRYAASAIYAESGALHAVSQTTWVETKKPPDQG